jgi:hypothetical protein
MNGDNEGDVPHCLCSRESFGALARQKGEGEEEHMRRLRKVFTFKKEGTPAPAVAPQQPHNGLPKLPVRAKVRRMRLVNMLICILACPVKLIILICILACPVKCAG